MKFSEQNIRDVFENEESIWQEQDLDWMNKSLVTKLLKNRLPPEDKQMIADMIANDQAVMNKYLHVKSQLNHKPASIFNFLRIKTISAIAAVFIAVIVLIITSANFEYTDNPIEIDTFRGVPEAGYYPISNSIINAAPEFFIIPNKDLQNIKIQLEKNQNIIWESPYQKSVKYHIPADVAEQLKSGFYIWHVMDKNNTIILSNTFKIE